MKITWSVPVPGEALDSGRGDLVRAARLIAAVRDAGHEVEVVHAGSRPRTAAAVSVYRGMVQHALPRSVAHALRDMGRVVHFRAHARRVALAAQRQGADLIVESQVHLSDSGACAARACGLPLVLDDCSPVGEEAALGSGIATLARAMFARQTQAASLLTVSSTVLRERLVRDGIAAEKISVIPNGVDLAAHRTTTSATARQRFNLDGGPVLGFAGSFQPWHRLDLLLDAMRLLETTRVVAGDEAPLLLLAGDGPALRPALEIAREFGMGDQVVHLGPLPPDEIPVVLAACDIGVLAGSNDYGQPMKLLEYAAAGLPAVAPDLLPVRAVVEHEQTGLLFPPGDAGALAMSLNRLLRDPALRHQLGAAGRRRMAEGAEWTTRAHDLVTTAARVLGGGQPC
ncbi:MAG TPA: glycosyltransferase family 4 protein [Gemmatimonadaceae bacterium]|nr:glycosyltransferase family 4 protein [Gemmatimonadaceae bacterium]